MIHSMTAFARSQKQIDTGLFSWEIRSVNHRYLDISFRIPENFRYLEMQLRAVLRDKVIRGKLECSLKYTSIDNQSMQINPSMANALVDLSKQLSASHHLANDLTVSQVLFWPGIVQINQSNKEELEQQVLMSFTQAVDELSKAKVTEGVLLKTSIESRLKALEQEVNHAKTLVSQLAYHTKDKLIAQLNTLNMEVSATRIEQEIALLLARQDVSEELDRLQIHCQEITRILIHDNIAGRRLDFLMQELNREANTLSSKADFIELTQSAVEMKVFIEQMREQIQNIE